MPEILEVAQKLYNEGKWKEAVIIIDDALPDLKEPENIAEAFRLKGWSRYYIGTKGLDDKQTSLQMSVKDFLTALDRTSESKVRISVLNGLPLSLWVLGEKDKAWQTSDHAIKEFPDEPSVWNTRAILCRWAKDFEQSVEVCEKVYVTALNSVDYRTAGHGKHNKADALKELNRIKEAEDEYAAAVGLYRKFEKTTGQSAKFHIDAVEKKMLEIAETKES